MQKVCPFVFLSLDLVIVSFDDRNRNSTQLCSNRGECVCGECQCHTRPDPTETVSGRFCECDNFSCARDINGHICGGPHRGLCCDGECHCMVILVVSDTFCNLFQCSPNGQDRYVTAQRQTPLASMTTRPKLFALVVESVGAAVVAATMAFTDSSAKIVQ